MVQCTMKTDSNGCGPCHFMIEQAMECEERDRLIREVGRTVDAYSVALKEMVQHAGTTAKDRYQKLKRASEDLRLQCENASLNLKRHRAIHRC